MAVLHAFVSAKPDSADATQVNASDWNADHVSPPFQYTLAGGRTTVTPPSAVTELDTAYRTLLDVSLLSAVHLVVSVITPASSGTVLRLQHSVDNGANWVNGPEVAIDAAGVEAGYVSTIAVSGDVLLRLVTSGGDGTTQAVLGAIVLREGGDEAPGNGFLDTDFRAAGTMGSASSTNIVVNKPAGTVEDDFLVAVIAVPATAVVTPPSGWTLAVSNQTLRIYTKVAGASEPSSWTFTQASAAWYTSDCLAYANSPGAVLDVYSTAFNGSYALYGTAPEVTTTDDDTLLLLAVAGAGTRTFTEASGMSERFDANSNPSLAIYEEIAESAGATGSRTVQASASTSMAVTMLAFRK